MSKVYIILPIHNRKAITVKFVKQLLSQSFQNFHLLIIDDGSTDGTVEEIKLLLANFSVVYGNGNLWWAGALNLGYSWIKRQQLSKDDFVILINDDVHFDITFLENGINFFRNSQKKSLLIAENYEFENKSILIDKGVYIDWRNFKFNKIFTNEINNSCTTRGLFMRAEDFLEIGGFYPILLPHYLSDYEYGCRAIKKGFSIESHPSFKLYTANDTTGMHSLDGLPFTKYIKVLFSKKYSSNPIYFTSFLLLSCPIKWIPLNFLRIWYGTMKDICKIILKKRLKFYGF